MQFITLSLISLVSIFAHQGDDMHEHGSWFDQISEQMSNSNCATICANPTPNSQLGCPCDLMNKQQNQNRMIPQNIPNQNIYNNNHHNKYQDPLANSLNNIVGYSSPTPTYKPDVINQQETIHTGMNHNNYQQDNTMAAGMNYNNDQSPMPTGMDHHHNKKWFPVSGPSYSSMKYNSLANKNYAASNSASGHSMAVPSSIAFPSKPTSMSKQKSASKSSDSLRNTVSLLIVTLVSVIVNTI